MAKRILSEYYTFDPATKTITIPNRILSREQLLLVVNVTSNTVLYNFSDPDLTLTSYTCPFSSTGTQFTLAYNTTSMSSSDPIMIMEDVSDERFAPIEVLQDPTNKLRVAMPQSLIDTDFEFGLQPIKWESLALLQNYPAYFYRGGANSLNITTGGISGGNQAPRSLITVTTVGNHGLVTSDLVNVSYTSNFDAEGVFVIVSSTATTFSYVARGQINGSIYTSAAIVQAGTNYDIGGVPTRFIVASISSDNAAANNAITTGSVITVNTTGKHGLLPGSPILVNSATTTQINGAWSIFDVPTATSFRYITPAIQTGTASPTLGSGRFMPRPEATFVHRASDGGVMISSNNIQEGVQAIRQTRRYFRYQSGKGLSMSTGTKFSPHYDVNTITAVGTSVTITTQQALGITSGVSVVIEGVETNLGSTNPYNGTFVVESVSSLATSRSFTYNVASASTDINPGGTNAQVTVKNWKGAACRVGMFDAQNGFYYEYDGQTLFAVRRQSIKELMGTVTATSGSTTVTGVNTKFHKQLVVGDSIVIRGQSYQVTAIDTATSMEISPPYRGDTAAGLRVNVTQNLRIPQSSWNLDRCDGSGPSGYNLDIGKMQMAYIDYTWYGAGFVRFGWRMTNGDVVYCHKIANNNVNNQAYMRSGNLPARYEVFNIGPYTKLVSNVVGTPGLNLGSGDAQMVVGDATYWPNDGKILVQQGANVEVMTYSGKEANTSIANTWTLKSLTRRQFGGSTSNLTFIPTEYEGGAVSTSSQCSITYIDCNCAPTVMHWGTSVIMDGGYDDDRSIVFAYARLTSLTTIAANTSIAVLSIRLAPSVDNSIAGQFGTREVINRMQLQMRALSLVCSTSVQVLGILNPTVFGGTTAPVFPTVWGITSIVTQIGAGSLAQIIDHTGNTTTVTGGEQIFGFVTSTGADNYDISNVRDLGNSIVSGPGSPRTPGFPNGPDLLTVVIRNNNAGAAVITNLRLGWTEAQA
jgi:hypothetical protein